ncbi:MAG: hypothetical protein HC802_03250 [Caldilineaceae bacterium]|nr:hypothetical protein [Caldilineaceae bacterium]
MVERGLPRGKVFLQRLDRGGIVEAILGPTQQQRLRDHYQLTVADGLADEIAADLLADRGSSVAPTLQILLSKLWERARSLNYDRPRFDGDLYYELRSQGLLLNDFLLQQLASLRTGQSDIVASGLALDLLAFHTTVLGTAEQRTLAELRETYSHQQTNLPALLATFRDLYLLVDPAENQPDAESASRLAHDTLAPLVRAQFDESDAPGQRARRILESRSVEWAKDGAKEGVPDAADDGADAAPLDRADLAVVEKGKAGMRAWTETEQRLIEASRQERARRERLQRILWVLAIGAVGIIAISSVFGWWQWGLAAERGVAESAARSTAEAEANKALIAESTAVAEATRAFINEVSANRSAELAATRAVESELAREEAEENFRRSHAGELIAGAQVLLAQEVSEPSLPLLLAIEAANRTLEQDGYVAPFADWNLQQVVAEAQRIGWRMTLPRNQHADDVNAAVFSPDGTKVLTASDDQTARLWDSATGVQLQVFIGHDRELHGAAYSPTEPLVATVGEDHTLRLWDVENGEALHVLQVGDCRVRSVDFSPTAQSL